MNVPLEAVAELPEEHRQAMMATLEHMQVRDSLRMYNRLVQRCFTDCVTDFRSKALDSTEEKCVARCCEKYLNVTARTGMRFHEFFTQMEEAAKEQIMSQQKK